MRFAAFACITFVSIRVAAGEEPATLPAEAIVSCPAACAAATCPEAERIGHLLEAAAHLAAAGKHDDARRCHSEAEEARRRLMTAKLAELAKLQAEVDRLRAVNGELVAPDEVKWAERRPGRYDDARLAGTESDDVVPLALSHPNLNEYWELTLDEALRTALSNSKVLRNLGGRLSTSRVLNDQPSKRMALARIDADVGLDEFEAGVRNFCGDLERAYWDLYYNYRNLDAVQAGRDGALRTWRKVHALHAAGANGGEAEKEAQAREHYFVLRAQVENSLGLLYTAESRLRYLMGLAPADGRLVRPKDEPTTAEVTFDRNDILSEAIGRSAELCNQKELVNKNERIVTASRHYLSSRLGPGARDCLSDLDGHLKNWSLGPVTVTVPMGFRLAMAGLRNAELTLAASRALLQDKELEVAHLMTNSIRDLDRNYQVSVTTFNRRVAAERQVDAMESAVDAGTATLDMLLDAQRRLADAEIAYQRALVDYNVAIMQVHFRKGSLLERDGIELVELSWHRGMSTGVRTVPNAVIRQPDTDDDAPLSVLVLPSTAEPAPELNIEFSAERAGYDAPSARSCRREPHPPRPFSAPSYQTPIRR